ncbi:hypothetical protein [Microbacterium sp. NPDC089696]|uniref:hypothetical protein n=1 Tax=Microbacterium sp. NPDC089696 TaxID=3364199 RepID=UPI0038147827
MIALIGSALVPWLREAFTERRAERRRIDRAKEQAIKDIVHALTKLAGSYATLEPDERLRQEEAVQDALTSLELILTLKEQPIASLLEQAFRDAATQDPSLRAVSKGATPPVLGAWFRGGVTPEEALAMYDRHRAKSLEDDAAAAAAAE